MEKVNIPKREPQTMEERIKQERKKLTDHINSAIYSYNRRNNQTFDHGIIWSKVHEVAKIKFNLKEKKKVSHYTYEELKQLKNIVERVCAITLK